MTTKGVFRAVITENKVRSEGDEMDDGVIGVPQMVVGVDQGVLPREMLLKLR